MAKVHLYSCYILLPIVYPLKYFTLFSQLSYQSLSMHINISTGNIDSVAIGIREMVLLPPFD